MVTLIPSLHNKLLLWQRAVANPSCLDGVYLLPLAVAIGSLLPVESVLEVCCRPVFEAGLGVGLGSVLACSSLSPMVPEQHHKSYSRALCYQFSEI